MPDDGDVLTGPGWTDFVFADTGADWYQVYIGYGSEAAVPYGYTGLSTWYQADDDSFGGTPGEGICVDGLCTLSADETLGVYGGGNEIYEWWLQSWTEADGISDWSLISTFEINYPAPATTMPTNFDPANGSTVNAAPVALTWDQEPGTLWYQIYLGPDNYSEKLVFDWFFADDICSEGTCVLDTMTLTFVDGTTYEVWIEMWGPGGYSTFADIIDNGLSFTYAVPQV